MGEIPEGRKDMTPKHSSWEAEAKALREENERLREGLRRIARLEQKGSKSAGQRVTMMGKIARDAMSERAAPLSELRDQARPTKADAPEQDMPDGFWEAEVKALRARVEALEETVNGIWCYAVEQTVSDHHFRGWAEAEARAALGGGQ